MFDLLFSTIFFFIYPTPMIAIWLSLWLEWTAHWLTV